MPEVIFKRIIEHFQTNCFNPINFYSRDTWEIYFFIFASCDLMSNTPFSHRDPIRSEMTSQLLSVMACNVQSSKKILKAHFFLAPLVPWKKELVPIRIIILLFIWCHNSYLLQSLIVSFGLCYNNIVIRYKLSLR